MTSYPIEAGSIHGPTEDSRSHPAQAKTVDLGQAPDREEACGGIFVDRPAGHVQQPDRGRPTEGQGPTVC